MKLNQPYYIEPRSGDAHLDLNGQWSFFYADDVVEQPQEAMWQYQTTLPKSLYHSICEAGILPDPYVGSNSKLYHWVDKKIWYYRKKFTLHKPDFTGNAYLCFEGIAYYCRLWVNGVLLGDHEGMFGGPAIDVAEHLNLCGENEIVVEVKAVNYGLEKKLDVRTDEATPQIVPWALIRDTYGNNGDFIVMGIWGRIRMEFTDKMHISRPYIYTKRADDNKAELMLEFEVADGTLQELHSLHFNEIHMCDSCNMFATGLSGATRDVTVEFHTEIREKDTGKPVYSSVDPYDLPDLYKLGVRDERYLELPFFSKTIEIENPRLWYPAGMGQQSLYDVAIELHFGGKCLDRQTLTTGIRTFTARRTDGPRYRTRWNDYHFAINGKEFFLKGMNWMPIDFLLGTDPEEYRWRLVLAKNAGIQLLRVWSGGGFPETDDFYNLCDSLGILVWQDHMVANTNCTAGYDLDVLECQESYNVYRIRNHPSLVIHCGGNEFNACHKGNAATMFTISRVVKVLDPAKLYYDVSPEGGSGHTYVDMEPAWYRHRYRHLALMAESGIHSFPTFHSLKYLLRPEETVGPMTDIMSEQFRKDYPDLLNHFCEYDPVMVPRALSRISQISNIRALSLEGMCEAGQVQAYEFYTQMVQAMRENYPVTGGVMPWVFNRYWTTVGVQVVDGSGRPTLQYYAIKNAYAPLNICLSLDWTVIAPGEQVPLKVKLLGRDGQESPDLTDAKITVTVYNPDLSVAAEHSCPVTDPAGVTEFDSFCPKEGFTDKCFLICAELTRGGEVLSRTNYWIKCTSALSDPQLLEQYRTKPMPNLFFAQGPWLKDNIQAGKQAALRAEVLKTGCKGVDATIDIAITNTSDTIAFPVTLDVVNKDARFYANDNFCLLKPGETKQLHLVCTGLSEGEKAQLQIRCWNAEGIDLTC